MLPQPITSAAPALLQSRRAKQRMEADRWEPLFQADWNGLVFLHFEVDPKALAPSVPFELDLDEEGRAWVTLVAFTMVGMHFHFAGEAMRWLTSPIDTHPFLNVRTYVQHQGESGIYFLCEWMNNRLAALLGPSVFGLPYRLGLIDYQNEPRNGEMRGSVRGRQKSLHYEVTLNDGAKTALAKEGSPEVFLLERYTAFTQHRLFRGFFRVWHPPWEIVNLNIRHLDFGILQEAPGAMAWGKTAQFQCAHYSKGAKGVWMGRPHRFSARAGSPRLNLI